MRANINPLEGIPWKIILFPILITFVVALLTSGIASYIFWGIFGILVIFEICHLIIRTGKPWGRIHYPLMIRYSAILGYYTGISKRTNEDFNINDVFIELLKTVYPHLGGDEILSILISADEKRRNFSDRKKLEEDVKRKNPHVNLEEMRDYFDKIEISLNNPQDYGNQVYYLIAEIIGKEYGEKERLRYIIASLKGDAK